MKFYIVSSETELNVSRKLIIPNSECKNFNRTIPKDYMEFTFLF